MTEERLSIQPSRVTYYNDGDVIENDTVWQGEVVVDGVLFVPETATLTIRPGTTVSFTRSEAQYRESGTSEAVIPGSGVRVEGRLVATGSPDAPITFTSSEAEPSPGSWGCVFFDHSKGSIFRYCRFEYSTYTLHAHFSSLDVSRCVLTNNIDGSRLGFSKVSIEHCDITGNTGKGLNFANCRNTVRYCNITGNYEGIFLNEHDAKCVIEENNIHSNTRFDLSLGEFHDEGIVTGANWWGTPEAESIADKVYDRSDDPEIGPARILPAKREIPNAGVDGLEVKLNWKFKTGGFVDSSPAIDGGRVYFGSWDHNLYCLDENTGELVWKFETGDCVDSSPAVYYGKVYFGSWDRNIYCLDAETGKEIWRFEMEPSNFDDHRQASPTIAMESRSIIMGGFNGNLYSLGLDDGNLKWKLETGGAIRSKALVRDEVHYISVGEPGCLGIWDENFGAVGSGDGYLYAFEPRSGKMLWKLDMGGPVNTTPAYFVQYNDNLPSSTEIYAAGKDGTLYNMDTVSGDVKWKLKVGERLEYSSPHFGAFEIITCDSFGRAQSTDMQGSKLWSFTGGAGIYSSPFTYVIITKGRIPISVTYGDNAGCIYWLDFETGSPVAVFHANDAVQGFSGGHSGAIYAGSRDGYLYSLSIGK